MTRSSHRNPKEKIPLSPIALYVLLALADGDRHGYAIIKEIETATGGAIRLLPGTLYRLIKQLVDDAWIIEVEAPRSAAADDDRRRYYRITPWGRQIAQAEVDRLAGVMRMARAAKLIPSSAAVS
jgi:DNA-binding PadR family transcriptional regulator